MFIIVRFWMFKILLTSYSNICSFFFLMVTSPTHIYTLSLHDALPISAIALELPWADEALRLSFAEMVVAGVEGAFILCRDRKSTRLNCSHSQISYAVFCLKKEGRLRLIYRLDC